MSELPGGNRWGFDRRRWGALLWAEWFAHRKLTLGVLLAWLATVWALPYLTQHPLWILMFGVVYAVIAGPAFGGADTINGCEEFMLSLPATRNDRFLSRLAFGGGSLLVLTAMDLMALGFNAPDVVDRVLINSGLTQALELRQPKLVYVLVAAFPLGIFSTGFSVSALARTRTVAFTAWVWGTLATLATLRYGTQFEEQYWERLNGMISVPALMLLSLVTLGISWRFYLRKEAGSEGSPLKISLGWWGWLAAVLLAAAAAGALTFWLTVNFDRIL